MQTVTRSSVHRKKPQRRMARAGLVVCLTLLLGGGSFLYGTEKGHDVRRMLVGTMLSTMNYPWILQYLPLLLPQAEIDELNALRAHPPTEQTQVAAVPVSEEPQAAPAKPIRVDTVETSHYTAKILVVPDPTTVHLVNSTLANEGQPLSQLLAQNHAVAGINAGGFLDSNGRGRGGQPVGIVISRGTVTNVPNGNRDEKQLVGAFRETGEFITGTYSVNELTALGVTEAVGFGPQLIVNGQSLITEAVDDAWGWAPRTAIGQAKDGSVVMIVTDGRFYVNKSHRGASMSDVVSLFQTYGVQNAIAMDGGGSTTMMKDGQLQLKPATSTAAGMRYLPNAWAVIPR